VEGSAKKHEITGIYLNCLTTTMSNSVTCFYCSMQLN